MYRLIIILLSFILDDSIWSSKNSNESSTKRLICDTCGKLQSINGMRQVFGGIHICDQCVDKILSSYVASSPIKTLCPFCYGKEGNIEKCKYCDIKSPEENQNNG